VLKSVQLNCDSISKRSSRIWMVICNVTNELIRLDLSGS
jgi:hypothetical protein